MNDKQNTKIKTQTSEFFINPEPWEPWESKLVIYSIIIAIVGLLILGVLINLFIL